MLALGGTRDQFPQPADVPTQQVGGTHLPTGGDGEGGGAGSSKLLELALEAITVIIYLFALNYNPHFVFISF